MVKMYKYSSKLAMDTVGVVHLIMLSEAIYRVTLAEGVFSEAYVW